VALQGFAWRKDFERAGLAKGAAYLLRPDSYVAMAEPHGDAAALDRYFTERGLTP
jgi:hypothetical protein